MKYTYTFVIAWLIVTAINFTAATVIEAPFDLAMGVEGMFTSLILLMFLLTNLIGK